MRAYLIGPMSGIKSFNYPAFVAAKAWLTARGFEVQSPTDLDDQATFDAAMASPDGNIAEAVNGLNYEDFIAKSVARILTWKPDILVAIEGWENSSGAQREAKIGEAWGIPTVELSTYDEEFGFPTETNGVHVYDAEGKFINYEDNPLRQRTITGGVKDNRGKLPIDLVPYEALQGAAEVLAYGAKKYKPNNWRLGLKWMETWSSLQRHLWAWKEGEDLDPETGLSHLDHAMCQMLFLATYAHGDYAQFDDRWVNSDHEAAKA